MKKEENTMEPVARVRIHMTGGNAGLAWSAVPTEDAPLMRGGELLYSAATVAALKAERDALREDAARYRWLRDESGWYVLTEEPWCTEGGSMEGWDAVIDMDAEIDAAIAAGEKT